MKRKIDENKIYLIKDGFISVWEFMEQTGTLDRMKHYGITINPTHSFELLKKTRLEIFEKVKQKFIEERKIKKLLTSDFEIGCLYHSWLKREFEIIKNWLLDKPSNSDQLEISKYNNFLYMEMIQTESEINPLSKQTETKTEQEQPKIFEELFYNPEHAEPCLKILSELQPPVIDAINNYIGKAKGVFPLWVKVLKNHKPEPLIKHFKDTVYKDLLNQKVKGLKLTPDASEFRKSYVRLEKNKIELDIKTILSQYSQSGKLGK
jgi:hypothetical protein